MTVQGQSRSPVQTGRFPVRPWADYVCIGLIILGGGLRIYHWLQDHSLWLDESYLAVNILDRGFGSLHLPLEYSQSAPYLFLVATKCVVSIFGPSEFALRAVPLTASLLSLWVFWRLAKETLPKLVVPVVLAIISFAYEPLSHAPELKQYSTEIFLTTLVAWQTARLFRHPEAPQRCFVALFVTGSLAIFAAHPMPFVLAGAGLAALWARHRRVLRLPYAWLFLAIAAWLALFLVNYLVILRPVYTDPVIGKYWVFAYPGRSATLAGLRSWFVLGTDYLSYLGYANAFKVLVAAALLGGAGFAWRTRHLATLAAMVTAGTYWLAALAGRAPFHGRLILFLFPLLLLVIGKGLEWLIAAGPRWIFALAAGALLVPTVARLPQAIDIEAKEDLRAPIVFLARARAPAEPVYVEFWAQPAFQYYRRARSLSRLFPPVVEFGHDDRNFSPATRAGAPPEVSPDTGRIVSELARLVPERKFWVLVAHFDENRIQLLRRIHDVLGLTPLITYRATGSSLYYFDAANAGAMDAANRQNEPPGRSS